MPFTLRPARPSDSEGIIAAHRRSIREMCRADYTPEQIEVWSGRDFSVCIWEESINRDKVDVVVDEQDKVLGFCHSGFEDETRARYEIKGLYFCPECAGSGLGKKLVAQAIAHGESYGCRECLAYSTRTARGFYEHMGFRCVGERLYPLGTVELEGHIMVRG